MTVKTAVTLEGCSKKGMESFVDKEFQNYAHLIPVRKVGEGNQVEYFYITDGKEEKVSKYHVAGIILLHYLKQNYDCRIELVSID